jgi:hypothetical protein
MAAGISAKREVTRKESKCAVLGHAPSNNKTVTPLRNASPLAEAG